MVLEEFEAMLSDSNNISNILTRPNLPSLSDEPRKSAFLPYKAPITVLTNLQRGNTASYTNESQQPLLDIFQLSAKGELEEWFIQSVENIDMFDQSQEGLTPLMWASAYGQSHTVSLLLKAGAIADLENSLGQTALHFASIYGHPEVVNVLVAYGADVNHIDEKENTPLHLFVQNNHPECVKLLLKLGADISLINEENETAHHIAVRLEHTEIEAILEKYMKCRLCGKEFN